MDILQIIGWALSVATALFLGKGAIDKLIGTQEMVGNFAFMKLEEIEREEVRAVNRTDLYNSILSIVKQIPRENVESDAMDAQSCAYEIEQLFYKWQKYNNHYNRIFP